jgi:hypothetical protein
VVTAKAGGGCRGSDDCGELLLGECEPTAWGLQGALGEAPRCLGGGQN